MSRVRRTRALLIVLAALTALSGLAAATIFAAGYGTTIHAGNLVIRFHAAISPQKLPKDRMAPISFHANASVGTADGTHVPAAKTIQVQVDKHFRFDTTGLPSCTPGRLAASTPEAAMKACGPALIGKGTAAAQVEFAESTPFTAKGPLLAFNGPAAGGYGYREQLYYIFVSVPVPTAVVVVAKLSKDTGRYGYKVSVVVPQIAGGAGSVTSVDFGINRKWTYKGKQHSFLNADCPNGYFYNRVEIDYGDGTTLKGSIVNPCGSKG